MAKQVIVAFVPVLHKGYYQFFEANPQYRELYILNTDVSDKYRALQKEVRSLSPKHARQAVAAWNLFDSIIVADQSALAELAASRAHILMPDDDISHDLAATVFENNKVSFYPVFLRWDRRAIEAAQPVNPDATVSQSEADAIFMRLAHAESFKSSDIWRRLGAAIVKEGEIVCIAHNKTQPNEYSTWLHGDPRSHQNRGESIEISIAQHAESCTIAEAAKKGIALEGSDMYVSAFPCPQCAMLIAASGIARLFYSQGYSVLDGQRILQDNGVQLIRIETDLVDDYPEAYAQYPPPTSPGQNQS